MAIIKTRVNCLKVGDTIELDGVQLKIISIETSDDHNYTLEIEDARRPGNRRSIPTFSYKTVDVVDTRRIIQLTAVGVNLVALCDDNTVWTGLITSGDVEWRHLNSVPTTIDRRS